jgi:hypothetical protein
MAYAILVTSVVPLDGTVAWPFRIQLADKTADVLNPSVDLLQAAFWFVSVKIQVKAAVGANSVILQSADVLAGTGNVQQLGPSTALGTAILGAFTLQGWFPRSQQFLNIDVTITTSMTYDAEVWATQLK